MGTNIILYKKASKTTPPGPTKISFAFKLPPSDKLCGCWYLLPALLFQSFPFSNPFPFRIFLFLILLSLPCFFYLYLPVLCFCPSSPYHSNQYFPQSALLRLLYLYIHDTAKCRFLVFSIAPLPSFLRKKTTSKAPSKLWLCKFVWCSLKKPIRLDKGK